MHYSANIDVSITVRYGSTAIKLDSLLLLLLLSTVIIYCKTKMLLILEWILT